MNIATEGCAQISDFLGSSCKDKDSFLSHIIILNITDAYHIHMLSRDDKVERRTLWLHNALKLSFKTQAAEMSIDNGFRRWV